MSRAACAAGDGHLRRWLGHPGPVASAPCACAPTGKSRGLSETLLVGPGLLPGAPAFGRGSWAWAPFLPLLGGLGAPAFLGLLLPRAGLGLPGLLRGSGLARVGRGSLGAVFAGFAPWARLGRWCVPWGSWALASLVVLGAVAPVGERCVPPPGPSPVSPSALRASSPVWAPSLGLWGFGAPPSEGLCTILCAAPPAPGVFSPR